MKHFWLLKLDSAGSIFNLVRSKGTTLNLERKSVGWSASVLAEVSCRRLGQAMLSLTRRLGLGCVTNACSSIHSLADCPNLISALEAGRMRFREDQGEGEKTTCKPYLSCQHQHVCQVFTGLLTRGKTMLFTSSAVHANTMCLVRSAPKLFGLRQEIERVP